MMTGWRAYLCLTAVLVAALCADSIGDFLFPPEVHHVQLRR
jgi:hypothetical protein